MEKACPCPHLQLKWGQSRRNESLTCEVKVLLRKPLTRDSIRFKLSHIAGAIKLVGIEKNTCRKNESNPNKGELMERFLENKTLQLKFTLTTLNHDISKSVYCRAVAEMRPLYSCTATAVQTPFLPDPMQEACFLMSQLGN